MKPDAALPTAGCANDINDSFLFAGPGDGGFSAADLCAPDTAAALLEPFLRLHEGGDRAAVISMWSQWYFALLLAPWTRIALLHGWRLPMDPRDIRFSQGAESAVPEKFILADRGGKIADGIAMPTLLGQLMETHVLPVCRTFSLMAGIRPGLFWNNAAIRVAHGIDMAAEQGANTVAARAFLDTKTLADGAPNRLYKPVHLVEHDAGPKIIRRLCCLRYKLSGLEYCPSCPLLVAQERKCRHREQQG